MTANATASELLTHSEKPTQLSVTNEKPNWLNLLLLDHFIQPTSTDEKAHLSDLKISAHLLETGVVT